MKSQIRGAAIKTQRNRCGNGECAAMSVVVAVVGDGFTGREVCVCLPLCVCVCVFHSMVSELSQPLRRSQCSLRRRKEALSPKV